MSRMENPMVLPDAVVTSLPAQRTTSSFRLAMQILPAPKRAAMFALHAFCRAVDDIADGADSASDKRGALERWRVAVDACYAGAPPPAMAQLAPHVATYGLARADFHAVIDGMLMDAAAAPICAPPAATLDLYCDRVAGAVGRLAVRVFGLPRDDGILLAHHLGRALQLTNILRDIDEDAAVGRAYVPRELLQAVGIGPAVQGAGAAAIAAHPALEDACIALAAQACSHYDAAQPVLRRHPGAPTRAPRLMGAVYGALLARLMERGWTWPRAPVRIGTLERAGILLRHTIT
jgi:squalene synthase HpnD